MDWYNEPNPFYREIYGLGFDIITEDIPMQELVLTRLKDKFRRISNILKRKVYKK